MSQPGARNPRERVGADGARERRRSQMREPRQWATSPYTLGGALIASRQLAAHPSLKLRAAAEPIELDQEVVFAGQAVEHAQGDVARVPTGRQHIVGPVVARGEGGRPSSGVAAWLPLQLGLVFSGGVDHGG